MIEDERFEVTQYSSSWAANEIPTAAIMFAVGRNARTGDKAAVHSKLKKFKQMAKAVVWFEPKEEYDRVADWPKGPRKIFEGYFCGPAYRKINGKVHVVTNLLHWLVDLAASSCLTSNGHVSNPSALNAAAVLESLQTAGSGEGNYISMLVPVGICGNNVQADIWGAMKKIFTRMAEIPTMVCGPADEFGGAGDYRKNDKALDALRRIEGPAASSVSDTTAAVTGGIALSKPGAELAYKYGRPLEIDDLGIDLLSNSIASAIGNEFIESYASTSFWDKMINQWFSMFGMAIVPMVESAIVVADTPTYNGGFWKEIIADDYDSYDLTSELHRPLRGVGVIVGWEGQTGGGTGGPDDGIPDLGGRYVEDSVAPGDGMILFVSAPAWLRMLHSQPVYDTTKLRSGGVSKSSTTPGFVDPPRLATLSGASLGVEANKLYERYAHDVYVNSMLRGHGGTNSGKLRFDIAPLSIVRIRATTDKFIGEGQDDLAVPIYACIQRVTVAINAEAGMAGTTFTYTHTRTEEENKQPRTSVSRHPLFSVDSIHGIDKPPLVSSDSELPPGKHGCPLIPDYDIGVDAAAIGPPKPVTITEVVRPVGVREIP